jgi:hypothetical protein
MFTIELQKAQNGIIKSVTIENEEESITTELVVYEMKEDTMLDNVSKFLYDISVDLGLSTGNKFHNKTLKFHLDWGDSYKPSHEEIDAKIEYLLQQINELKNKKHSE